MNYTQFIKYICIGIFNTLVGYFLIFFCMYILGMTPVVSNTLSYAIGLSLTYFLNRRLTFKSSSKKRQEITRFFVAFFISYAANILTLIISIDYFLIHEAISQVIASVVYVMFSFPLLKFYVYKAAPHPEQIKDK